MGFTRKGGWPSTTPISWSMPTWGKAFSDVYFDARRCKAQSFRALPDLFVNLPDRVRKSKSIPLNNLDTRLKEWGLI
jgi:serine/threonine-protein kinase HipA